MNFIRNIIEWIKDIPARRRRKKRLAELRKRDPFIY